jgi:hypothetical protein
MYCAVSDRRASYLSAERSCRDELGEEKGKADAEGSEITSHELTQASRRSDVSTRAPRYRYRSIGAEGTCLVKLGRVRQRRGLGSEEGQLVRFGRAGGVRLPVVLASARHQTNVSLANLHDGYTSRARLLWLNSYPQVPLMVLLRLAGRTSLAESISRTHVTLHRTTFSS